MTSSIKEKKTHRFFKESSPLQALLQLMGLFLAALTQPTEPRSQVAAAGAEEGPRVLMGRLPLPVPLGQMHHSSLGLLIKPTLVFLMSSAWSFRAGPPVLW